MSGNLCRSMGATDGYCGRQVGTSYTHQLKVRDDMAYEIPKLGFMPTSYRGKPTGAPRGLLHYFLGDTKRAKSENTKFTKNPRN